MDAISPNLEESFSIEEESSSTNDTGDLVSFVTLDNLLNNERVGVLAPRGKIPMPQHRSNIVDWLIGIYIKFSLLPETYFATINIMDAVLARLPTERDDMQLLSIVCMYLASKYHEVFPPTIEEYVSIASSPKITVQTISTLQRTVFITMGCNLNIAQELDYFKYMYSATSKQSEVAATAQCLLITLTIEGSNFLHSLVVTAIRKIMKYVYDAPYVNYLQIDEDTVNVCIFDTVMKCQRIARSRAKYYKLLSGVNWTKSFTEICRVPSGNTETFQILPEFYRNTYYKANLLTIPLINPLTLPDTGDKLGEGSYGVVHKIKLQNVDYAIKRIKPTMSGDVLSNHILREISVLLSLDNNYVIKLKGITSDLSGIFFDLGACDLEAWTRGKFISKEMQVYLAYQLLTALTYMHDMGCLHRDIKPGNIIVYEYPEPNGSGRSSMRFVLADFGLARGCQIAEVENAFTGNITTLWFRAPEITLGTEQYDSKVDVWSMLCTLYYSVGGRELSGTRSELSQIQKVFSVFGTPNDSTWPGVTKLSNYTSRFKQYEPIEDFFETKDISDCYKEVLSEGFVLAPLYRPLSSQLLAIVANYL